MATADQIRALVQAHIDGNGLHFRACVLSIAANAEAKSPAFAKTLRTLADRNPHPAMLTALPTGMDQLLAVRPTAKLDDMVLDAATRDRLDRVLIEQRARETLFVHGLEPMRKLLFVGAPGVGKCLGRGVDVLLFDGSCIPVEQVKVGDSLMGPDGKARAVTALARGRAPMYRITPIKGASWTCNDMHVLTLVNSYTGKVIDVPLDKWLTSDKRFKHDYKQFSVGIDAFGAHGDCVHAVDPYFLGVWFGDGSKSLDDGRLARVAITKPDQEILAVCEEVALKFGLSVKRYNATGCPTWTLTSSNAVHSNGLLVAMRGLLGTELNVPSHYACAPRAVRLQFLAGFLDTDGELTHGCFTLTQKREDYARAVWWIARSLGFAATFRSRLGRCRLSDGSLFEGTYWRVTISGDTHLIPTRIPRKQAAPRQQIKNATRTGFSVVPIGEDDYFGFVLDGDGRFLLGDFTVTHNTLAASAIAGELGLPLLSVQLHATISSHLGETAAKIGKIFDSVRRVRAVYLFDEFDALAAERSADKSDVGEMRRVVNSLLTFIENDDSTSLIIAATNHHAMIDRAMFRRFDAIVTFPIPTDAIAERLIRQHLTRRGIQPHPDIDWASVRAAATGVGHADLVSACDRVSKDAVLAGRDRVFAIDLVTVIGERSRTFDTRSTNE